MFFMEKQLIHWLGIAAMPQKQTNQPKQQPPTKQKTLKKPKPTKRK